MKERQIKSCGKCHSDMLSTQHICHRCGERIENATKHMGWLETGNKEKP